LLCRASPYAMETAAGSVLSVGLTLTWNLAHASQPGGTRAWQSSPPYGSPLLG